MGWGHTKEGEKKPVGLGLKPQLRDSRGDKSTEHVCSKVGAIHLLA